MEHWWPDNGQQKIKVDGKTCRKANLFNKTSIWTTLILTSSFQNYTSVINLET